MQFLNNKTCFHGFDLKRCFFFGLYEKYKELLILRDIVKRVRSIPRMFTIYSDDFVFVNLTSKEKEMKIFGYGNYWVQ